MREYNLRFFCFGLLLMGTMFIMNSCGEEEVVGCTDPNAENYNQDANTDGDCSYARDKFIGTYLGSLACPGFLSLIGSDSLVFSIQEFIDADSTDLIILSLTVEGNKLDLAGRVDGDVLTIMHTAEGVGIPNPLGGDDIPADVTATGEARVSSNNGTLDGTLNLVALTSLSTTPIEDDCTIMGVKQ